MKPWFVKDTDFSERISDGDMGVFRSVCPDRTYGPGERIFHAGDPARDVHVITRGQVKLVAVTSTGDERILAICGPNDFIGEAFVSADAVYRADAVALTHAVTCPVSRSQFLQLALHAPRVVTTFAEILASHLFHCRDQLSGSYASVEARLARVLLEQVDRFGEPEDGGWVRLSTALKHEELASMISATRVSVSMALSEMREQGVAEGTRGEYRFHRPGLVDRSEDLG